MLRQVICTIKFDVEWFAVRIAHTFQTFPDCCFFYKWLFISITSQFTFLWKLYWSWLQYKITFFTQFLPIVVAPVLNHFELKFFELFVWDSHCLHISNYTSQGTNFVIKQIRFKFSLSSFCRLLTVLKFAYIIFNIFSWMIMIYW